MNETNETTSVAAQAVPEAAPPPVYLTFEQMHAHMERLRGKPYRVWKNGREYLAHNRITGGYKTVGFKSDAAVFTIGHADYWLLQDKQYVYELEDQALAATLAALPIPKCDPVKLLGKELINMITTHPNNPTFRAMVMAKSKQMPPEGLTGEQVVDWVKFNCGPTPGGSSGSSEPATPVPRPNGLSFELNYEDTEVGTCRYSVRRDGQGTLTIDHRTIMDIVEESLEDLDGVIEGIEEYVYENAMEDTPDMEWDEDGPDYDDHDPTDHDGDRWSYDLSTARRRDMIIDYLRNHLTPEQLTELGL